MVDYAIANEMTDVYSLMYEYADLGQTCDRSQSKITNDNDEEHKEHLGNARHFLYFVDRKTAAKDAIESVFSKICMQLKTETGQKYIDRREKEIGYKLSDTEDEDVFGLRDYYSRIWQENASADEEDLPRETVLEYFKHNLTNRSAIEGIFKRGSRWDECLTFEIMSKVKQSTSKVFWK
ncbi:hypothetical protein AVEN_140038-1 [Araneus ventricosus]|uniref:Uncharacterized protein n=1 Tax=Araneus ventricosus TaxID=182803 RepID=A0A4Y2QW64_ARAVE|nr:hypothetical protein AVEN_140038-1 [Araneus ventricosus]